jgi:malate dehydrogenase (oxaloacetate-decarboxylating)
LPKCWPGEISGIKLLEWAYTPGVAEACREIVRNPDSIYDMTGKGNRVLVVSNGTRVLGLGDIGPWAGEPVMEGKALIFNLLGGIDAMPLSLKTKDPDEFINIVKNITPSVGGINLEDIRKPDCFYILDRLQKELEIPVWHDDQQGTAAVTLATVINGLKVVGKKIEEARFAIIGLGAANTALMRILIPAGANPDNIIIVDSKGILYYDREDITQNIPKRGNEEKWYFAEITNQGRRMGDIEEALVGADVGISYSMAKENSINPEWVKKMAPRAIFIAGENPIPRIWPEDLYGAGVEIVATGRTDFPNQCNNSLIFPAVFRGVFDVRAAKITVEMTVAAAEAIAKYQERKGLDEKHILPSMDEIDVFIEEAVAVGMKAMEQGIAKIGITENSLKSKVKENILRVENIAKFLTQGGFIKKYKE